MRWAAEIIAQAVAEGHTFSAWSGPHSSLPDTDIFWRAGGLAIVNAVFTPGFCLEIGPLRPTSFLERVEGYGREFFQHIGAEAGDVILLVSTSGRNAFPIEMAMAAKYAGLRVIGMTSLEYGNFVPSRHSSGSKMYEYCDLVLDNLTTPGDASLEDARLPQKVGPTSGWVGCFILQALMSEVAERLAIKGIKPQFFMQATWMDRRNIESIRITYLKNGVQNLVESIHLYGKCKQGEGMFCGGLPQDNTPTNGSVRGGRVL